ncbi:hypothetical protein BKA65DRAFT_536827 [Rhexocercosporidium sp. MPI-PUGE-AT-0058]|nr:hypothetical protein BKA65DRAFT_536827 [Rhexocercosporidium sp. MPI-PUGE-AT-0058]
MRQGGTVSAAFHQAKGAYCSPSYTKPPIPKGWDNYSRTPPTPKAKGKDVPERPTKVENWLQNMQSSSRCLSRTRRVKCDEGVPVCQRCLKSGYECDGYELNQRPGVVQIATRPKLLPKTPARSIISWARPEIAVPAVHPPGQPQDLEYFRYFQEQTVLELCGGFDEPLWNRFVLQACQEAPFVRHIALSLAAKGRAERARLALPQDNRSEIHETYALRKYLSSLPQIRQYLAGTSNPDPRMFLIAGLLIFLFEFHQGNRTMATKQLKTTLALFKNMRSIKSEEYTHMHLLPFPDTLEGAIIEMVVRLESHIAMDPVGQTEKAKGKDPDGLGIIHVYDDSRVVFPVEFSSVFEAQRFHNHIQHWGRPNFPGDASKYIIAYLKRGMGAPCDIPPPRIVSVEEYSNGLWEMKSWGRSFRPLLAKLKAAKSSQYACALVLYIQWLVFLLVITRRTGWVLGSLDPRSDNSIEEPEESDEELCREAVESGKELCSNEHFLRCFTFDPGAIPTLFMVIFCTEDMEIRSQVAGILRDMIPRRESVWDSVVVSNMADILLSRGASLQIP